MSLPESEPSKTLKEFRKSSISTLLSEKDLIKLAEKWIKLKENDREVYVISKVEKLVFYTTNEHLTLKSIGLGNRPKISTVLIRI